MRLATLATLALTTLAFPAFAQKVGETINVGGWKVFSSKNTDGSTMCAATFTYDDKSVIGFTIDNDYDAFFLVSEPTAKMAANEKYQVTYRIDRGKSITGMGIATSAEMLVVPIANDDITPLFTAFMKGNSLFITMGKEQFEEPLEGSNDAIGALSDCQDKLPKRGKK